MGVDLPNSWSLRKLKRFLGLKKWAEILINNSLFKIESLFISFMLCP